jgi:hypothetical protein
MKRPQLLCLHLQRGPSLALQTKAARPWRPLSLCWPRRARREEPVPARILMRAVHQHKHLTQHFHRTTEAATPRRMPAAKLQPASAPRTECKALIKQTVRRELALRHTHVQDTQVQRESLHLETHRREVLQPLTVERSRSISMFRTFVIPGAHSSRVVSQAPGAVTDVRRSPPRPLTPARFPVRSALHEQPVAVRPRPPVAAAPLVWHAEAPPPRALATPQSGRGIDAAAPDAAPTPLLAPAAAPLAAPPLGAGQTREAVRAQLLDPALADRLADDVIRRVEKRLRIERERRGL